MLYLTTASSFVETFNVTSVSSNIALFIGAIAVIVGAVKSFIVNVTEAVPKFPAVSLA